MGLENAQVDGNAISNALGFNAGTDTGEGAREAAVNPNPNGLSADRQAEVLAAQRARLQALVVPD